MIVQEQKLDTEVLESTGEEGDCGFILDRHMVNALTIGLYLDPVGSMIREYVSNASDAHEEAGIPDRKVVVHLPTDLEPFLGFRDYGFGMSHDIMTTVFVIFGASLKRNTNALKGGFGVGAKLGYAYGDRQFTVICRHAGKRIGYLLRIKEDGMPGWLKLGEEEMEPGEETGTEVRIQIRPSDFATCRTKYVQQIRFWKVKPEVNIELDFPEEATLTSGDGWTLLKSPSATSRILLGEVSYPLDKSQISHPVLNAAAVWLHFETGDLMPIRSRENIAYDEAAIAKIKARLDLIEAEMVAVFEAEAAKCKTIWEYQTFLHEAKANGYAMVHKIITARGGWQWKGRAIGDSSSLDFGALVRDLALPWENYEFTVRTTQQERSGRRSRGAYSAKFRNAEEICDVTLFTGCSIRLVRSSGLPGAAGEYRSLLRRMTAEQRAENARVNYNMMIVHPDNLHAVAGVLSAQGLEYQIIDMEAELLEAKAGRAEQARVAREARKAARAAARAAEIAAGLTRERAKLRGKFWALQYRGSDIHDGWVHLDDVPQEEVKAYVLLERGKSVYLQSDEATVRHWNAMVSHDEVIGVPLRFQHLIKPEWKPLAELVRERALAHPALELNKQNWLHTALKKKFQFYVELFNHQDGCGIDDVLSMIKPIQVAKAMLSKYEAAVAAWGAVPGSVDSAILHYATEAGTLTDAHRNPEVKLGARVQALLEKWKLFEENVRVYDSAVTIRKEFFLFKNGFYNPPKPVAVPSAPAEDEAFPF